MQHVLEESEEEVENEVQYKESWIWPSLQSGLGLSKRLSCLTRGAPAVSQVEDQL